MNHRFSLEQIWTGISLAAGCVTALLLQNIGKDGILQLGSLIGEKLRNLSLAGKRQNILAWLIVSGVSCLPLLGLLRKKRMAADFLLILSGAEIFVSLYYLVNPFMIALPKTLNIELSHVQNLWGLVSMGCALATLICWVFLRLLKAMQTNTDGLLPKLLICAAVIYAFLTGAELVRGAAAQMAVNELGNTDAARAASGNSMTIFLSVIKAVPNALGAGILLMASRLAGAMDTAPFSEETVALAEEISARSIFIAKVSLILTVIGNLVQMLFFSKTPNINIHLYIPLFSLTACVILILLCEYFKKAKSVSDDNASII